MTPSDILLTDQVAIITGGANGIGKGIAVAMAQFGAHIVIADTDVKNGEKTAREIKELDRDALFIETNVADSDDVRSMINQARARFGRLDILVNNAGGTRQIPFVDHSERSWKRHIDLNLMSMLNATQAFAKTQVEDKRGGCIINIASSEGLRAAPGYAVYAACKAGMVSFTRTMAIELSPEHIRVCALAPDMIMTPGLKPFYDAATAEEVAARDRYIPLGRIGDVDEMGGAAVFLASSMASYITGVVIPVDGGTIASSGWTKSTEGDWALYHAVENS